MGTITSLLLFSVVGRLILGLLLTIGCWCCFGTKIELFQCSNTLFRFCLIGWKTFIICLDLTCAMLLNILENTNTVKIRLKREKEGCYLITGWLTVLLSTLLVRYVVEHSSCPKNQGSCQRTFDTFLVEERILLELEPKCRPWLPIDGARLESTTFSSWVASQPSYSWCKPRLILSCG